MVVFKVGGTGQEATTILMIREKAIRTAEL
jgi:hypothetical protein